MSRSAASSVRIAVQFRLEGGVIPVGEHAAGEGQIRDQRLGQEGRIAEHRFQQRAARRVRDIFAREGGGILVGQRAACSAQRSSPTWTAVGSAGFGGVMREDGTGTGIVDTIGTSYLAEGCLRLRADRAKVNRSAMRYEMNWIPRRDPESGKIHLSSGHRSDQRPSDRAGRAGGAVLLAAFHRAREGRFPDALDRADAERCRNRRAGRDRRHGAELGRVGSGTGAGQLQLPRLRHPRPRCPGPWPHRSADRGGAGAGHQLRHARDCCAAISSRPC